MQVVCEGVLWKYHQLKNGEFSVKVRMTNFRTVEYVNTKLSCSLEHWDEQSGEPKTTHHGYRELIKKIDEIKDEIRFALRLAEKTGDAISLLEIKNNIEGKSTANVVVSSSKKILEFYDQVIKEAEDEERIGSSNLFMSNKSFIAKWLNNQDRPFSAVRPEDFQRLESIINKLNSESTKSNYLRTFYRVWNIAIKRKLCPEKHHPKHYIGYKVYRRIRTKKRAVPFETIQQMEKLDYPYESRLFRSLQYAIFIYYSRGMNFNDLCKLKRGVHVRNGHLEYRRSKNKRHYQFELHPKAKAVVDIFLNYPMQSEAGYLFPLLDKQHNTAKLINTRIITTLKDFNDDLEVLEEAVGSPKHITSYTLRHSFATNLRQKRVDLAIIKEAMGHETESQTNVYLEDIDDTDVANAINEALK